LFEWWPLTIERVTARQERLAELWEALQSDREKAETLWQKERAARADALDARSSSFPKEI